MRTLQCIPTKIRAAVLPILVIFAVSFLCLPVVLLYIDYLKTAQP